MNDFLLKDIAVSQTGPFGSQLHESDYVDFGTPIVTVEHLGETGFSHQNLPLVSDIDKARLSKYLLKEGDIVFSRVGSVDRNTYVSKNEDGWLFSGRCIRVRVDKTKADPRFISFYFRQRNFKEMMLNISVGATMPSLNTSLMDNIPLRLPDLETQQKIAKVLSDLDAKIELNNRINAELEAMAKLVYEYWFVQFDFPFDFAQGKPNNNGKPYKSSGGKMVWNEELKREVPEGWEVVQIDHFAEIIDPHPSHRAPIEVKNGFPFAGIGDIDDQGNIDVTKARSINEDFVNKQERDYSIRNYSLGFGRVGTVGKVVKLRKQDFRYALSPTMAVINPIKDKFPSFVFYTLKGSMFYNWVKKFTVGSTRPAIGIQELRKIPVLKPSPKDEYLIDLFEKSTLETITKSDILNKQNQELSKLRDWLLPMLMNGQVRVEEAEERVEEELGMVVERDSKIFK
jgi:type I restriction enzyme S subunit